MILATIYFFRKPEVVVVVVETGDNGRMRVSKYHVDNNGIGISEVVSTYYSYLVTSSHRRYIPSIHKMIVSWVILYL